MKLSHLYTFLMLVASFTTLSATHYLPHQHSYYQYTAKIYQQLLNSSGDFSRKAPRLEVWTIQSSMALYNNKEHIILVDSSIVGLCKRSFQGSTALAFLLGHELIHFYKKHNHQKAAFAANNENFNRYKQHETVADREGAFLAYMAGYNVLQKLPSGKNIIVDFFTKAYKLYQLEAEVKGYLPLDARKKAQAEVLAKTKKTIAIYEAGKRFAALEMNIQAQLCFQYIMDSLHIRNKHLINNLATSKLQIVRTQTPPNIQPYLFPILLNTSSSLLEPFRGQSAIFEPIPELLHKTLHYYKEIIDMDPSYYPAFLGYAYTLLLGKIHKINLGEEQPLSKALNIIQIAKNKSQVGKKSYFELAEGVILALMNKKQEAATHFQKATALASRDPIIIKMAQYNSLLLRGGAASKDAQKYIDMSNFEDAIGLYHPIDLQEELEDKNWNTFFDRNIMLRNTDFYKMSLWQKEKQGVHIFNFKLDSRTTTSSRVSNFLLLYTKSAGYPSKAGVRVGQSVARLKKAYNGYRMTYKPQQKGNIILIPQLNIYFVSDEAEKITEWGIFAN